MHLKAASVLYSVIIWEKILRDEHFLKKSLEKIIPLVALQDVILDDCFRIWGILRNLKKK